MSQTRKVGTGRNAATTSDDVTLVNGSTGAPLGTDDYPLIAGTPGDVITVTCTLDTSAYAAGDVLFDMQEVAGFMRENGGRAIIQSITVLDKDDQGVAFDIITSPNANSLGTENAAPSVSDANADGMQRLCRIEASDYIDLGGCKLATRTNLGLQVESGAASTSMYIGGITQGAPTHSASGLVLRIGVVRF